MSRIQSLARAQLSHDLARFFPFWYKLTPMQQRRLADTCTVRQYHAGEDILFHQICNGGLVFVYEGSIRAYMISPHGREATICRRVRGETGVVLPLNEHKAENVIPVFQAEEDSLIAYIAKSDVYRAALEHPEMLDFYTDVTSACVQEIINSFFSFAFLPLQARVARILLERARASGSTKVSATHEMLAGATGTSREVATRTLGKMQADGILRTGRGQVEILDMKKLEALASLTNQGL